MNPVYQIGDILALSFYRSESTCKFFIKTEHNLRFTTNSEIRFPGTYLLFARKIV